MFTGIITDVGEIAKIEKIKDTRAKILCTYNLSEVELGASICCDGVCLTVEKVQKNKIFFYISRETLKRSHFKSLKLNQIINFLMVGRI